MIASATSKPLWRSCHARPEARRRERREPQHQHGQSYQAVVAVALEHPVPRDRRRVDVMLAERRDDHRSDERRLGIEVRVADPVDQPGGDVGREESQHEPERERQQTQLARGLRDAREQRGDSSEAAVTLTTSKIAMIRRTRR